MQRLIARELRRAHPQDSAGEGVAGDCHLRHGCGIGHGLAGGGWNRAARAVRKLAGNWRR